MDSFLRRFLSRRIALCNLDRFGLAARAESDEGLKEAMKARQEGMNRAASAFYRSWSGTTEHRRSSLD
jgi:hypothetical protein